MSNPIFLGKCQIDGNQTTNQHIAAIKLIGLSGFTSEAFRTNTGAQEHRRERGSGSQNAPGLFPMQDLCSKILLGLHDLIRRPLISPTDRWIDSLELYQKRSATRLLSATPAIPQSHDASCRVRADFSANFSHQKSQGDKHITDHQLKMPPNCLIALSSFL